MGKELAPDAIAALLELSKPKPRNVGGPVVHLSREEWDKREAEYDRSHWPETFECLACGHCPNPGNCVQSVTCPKCGAGVSTLCKTPTGGLTGFHEERWLLTKEANGVYYR
jgi:hypothetical protein